MIESHCHTREEMLKVVPGHDAIFLSIPMVRVDREFLDVTGIIFFVLIMENLQNP